jgi:hypothetical protein
LDHGLETKAGYFVNAIANWMEIIFLVCVERLSEIGIEPPIQDALRKGCKVDLVCYSGLRLTPKFN